jgi:hypothetical protein
LFSSWARKCIQDLQEYGKIIGYRQSPLILRKTCYYHFSFEFKDDTCGQASQTIKLGEHDLHGWVHCQIPRPENGLVRPIQISDPPLNFCSKADRLEPKLGRFTCVLRPIDPRVDPNLLNRFSNSCHGRYAGGLALPLSRHSCPPLLDRPPRRLPRPRPATPSSRSLQQVDPATGWTYYLVSPARVRFPAMLKFVIPLI